MSILTILFLSLFSSQDLGIKSVEVDVNTQHPLSMFTMVNIDSLDRVIFSLDQIQIEGDIVQIPVFVATDDIINALDFSMLINVENLEFLSIVEHAEELQYAAFLNPNDLKLRFTSNSFSPYPLQPLKAVSIRFRVLSGILKRSDFSNFACYLNGERCTCDLQLKGVEIPVSSKEVETSDLFIAPNPATDFLYIESDEEGTLDMFDALGRAVIRGHKLNSTAVNHIDIQLFPRGSYTVRIVSKYHTMKVQKILLQ